LKSVLDTAFAGSGAFEIELSDIVTRAAWRPADPNDPVRYRSLCLGHQRLADELPARLLHGPAPTTGVGPGEALTEVGVFVFVAHRL
jgi:hypothetical protein